MSSSVHNVERDLESLLKRIERTNEICDENKRLIREFCDQMIEEKVKEILETTRR